MKTLVGYALNWKVYLVLSLLILTTTGCRKVTCGYEDMGPDNWQSCKDERDASCPAGACSMSYHADEGSYCCTVSCPPGGPIV